ncbi:MAG: hypothetical protein K2J88_05725 [Oscillospiraceae bacterium]|nr:hypothetical protein [Oscillospiraceae bacterium]
MHDDEYFRRYTELSELIARAYADYYILKAVEIYKKEATKEHYWLAGAHVVSHWCILTVDDLGLTIWKIADSNETKSNTIITLKNYLISTYNKDLKPKLNKTLQQTRDELGTIRKQFLAHNDITKSGTNILVTDLHNVLEDIEQYFNILYCPDIDNRVSAFKRPSSMKVTLELLTLLGNSSTKKETDEN